MAVSLPADPSVARHRRNEEPVHCPLGRAEQIRGLGGIEPAAPSGYGQLAVEGLTEAEEALHCMAEREPEARRRGAVFGRGNGRFSEVMLRRLLMGRIQVLEEPGCESMTSLPEEEALLVREGQNPWQLGRHVPAGATVGSRYAGGSQPATRDRRAS